MEAGAPPPWAVSSGYWLEELTPEALARAGDLTLALLVDAPKWIHRRVEKVEFGDDRLARHRVSVDFSLPPDLPPVGQMPGGAKRYLAPLFFLPKDHPNPVQEENQSTLAVYSGLDLVDGAGASVPLINRRQGSRIAGAALQARARQLLGPDLGNLEDYITRIAVSDSVYGGYPALDHVMEDPAGNVDERVVLRDDATFRELAYAFASHWLVLRPFVGPQRRRMVLKLAYNKRSQRERGPLHVELRKGLGWKSTVFLTRLTQIGAAASYHLEISAPPDLEMTEVGLFGQRYDLGWKGFSGRTDRMRRPDPHNYYILQPERTTAAHVYLPEGPDRRIGAAWVKFRARRQGFLTAALLTAGVISLTLFLYAAFAEDILGATKKGGSSAAVTALMLLPTLLAAYIARPGEHAITGRILRLLRLTLVVDGGLPFIAAVLLVKTQPTAGPHEIHVLIEWLNWLARASLVFIVVFLISIYLPRPHGSWEYSLGTGGETADDHEAFSRRIIFGRILPAGRADEAYVTTLRTHRQERGRFLPHMRADEAYIATLYKWGQGVAGEVAQDE